MSLKTCRLLQTVAVILFALAFLIVLLSVPMKNTFINLAYPNHIELTGNMDVLHVSVFPSINFIAALVYLALSLVHFAVLKKPDKQYILISVVACSIAFFLYKVFSPALNSSFTARALARGEAEGSAYYNAYALLENSLYGILPFLTVPGSILMFLSFGGSIGKGAENASAAQAEAEPNAAVNAAPAAAPAAAAATAAPAAAPSAPRSAAPKGISLPGLEEPEIDPETYRRAFQRPSADAPQEASEASEPASDDPDAYSKAFQRPKNN